MPAYNAADTIAESALAVLAQTYGHLELLVADDGSTDGTDAVVRNLAARDARIRVLPTAGRLGAPGARNHALSEAKGRYIAFCDSDDLWHADKLQRQISFMSEHRSGISATSFQRIDNAGTPISRVSRVEARVGVTQLLRYNSLCCASVVCDVTRVGVPTMVDYRTLGTLPTYLRWFRAPPLHEDFIAWVTLLKQGPQPRFVDGLDEVLTFYRVRDGSHSANKAAAALARWHILRNVLGLPYGKALGYFFVYAANATARRI